MPQLLGQLGRVTSDRPHPPLGRHQIILRHQPQHQPPLARRHRHPLKPQHRLIHIDRVGFFGTQGRDAAANVARQRLHVFEGHGSDVAIARQHRQSLEIQLGAAGNDRQANPGAIAPSHQGLKHLLRRQSQLFRRALGGQGIGVKFSTNAKVLGIFDQTKIVEVGLNTFNAVS